MPLTTPAIKSVLCVVAYFPPDASTGTHRARAIARYLPQFGWRPVVVCPRLERHAIVDPSLMHGLPRDLVVCRTPAPNLLENCNRLRSLLAPWRRRQTSFESALAPNLAARPHSGSHRGWKDWLSWWLQVPDMMSGWLPFAVHAGMNAIRRHRCRAIFSSAPQWTTHLVALVIKRLTGLPWVADFRDPWRSNPLRQINQVLVNRLDSQLERWVIDWTDWVVCNTGPLREDFAHRYPQHTAKFVTVPNGFDPEDFAALKPQRLAGPSKRVMTHAGWFYGRRRPEPIFKALRLLRERSVLSSELCLQLVGHPAYEGKPLQAIAADFGVADMVLVPGEVSHQQALELMRGSDIQILVGFSGAGSELQVPAKLYEYLGVGRPVLALAPRQSAISQMLALSGTANEVCDADDPEQIAAAIIRMESRCESSIEATTETPAIAYFHRREQVCRIARLFSERPDSNPSGTGHRCAIV